MKAVTSVSLAASSIDRSSGATAVLSSIRGTPAPWVRPKRSPGLSDMAGHDRGQASPRRASDRGWA